MLGTAALLDPAALMQLQMEQRAPEMKWLSGAAAAAAAVAAAGCMFARLRCGGLCLHLQQPQAFSSTARCTAAAALLPHILTYCLSPLYCFAGDGVWVEVPSANVMTLAGLLAQAAAPASDATPGEGARWRRAQGRWG
jgi:hypothetical protein